MTIYYVDPLNGSNTNAGTSWATAWKYLPGNGTAIVPGDEIRYAKSELRATTTSLTGKQYTSWAVETTYANGTGVSAPFTWVSALTGVANVGGGISIASGTVVPANTKLAYCVNAVTQTTKNRVEVRLRMNNIPSGTPGQYLKYCLCSDAAGNTPIATLTGPTIYTQQTGNTVLIHAIFAFDSASTLNLTIGSVAIYSGTSGFTPTALAYIYSAGYGFGPISTANDYVPYGAKLVNTDRAKTWVETTVAPIPECYRVNDKSYGTQMTFSTVDNLLDLLSTTYPNGTLQYYMPSAISDQDYVNGTATLTFSGTAGNPIKISGGWNTSSGLQDGYTNLGTPYLTSAVLTSGMAFFFVFTSGGDYLEFSNFLMEGVIPLTYNYNTAGAITINSLKFFKCELPDVAINFINTTTSPTFNSITYDTCTVYNPLCPFYTTLGNFTLLTVGNITVLDSWLSRQAPRYVITLTGAILITSSAGTPYKTVWANYNTNPLTANSSTGTITVSSVKGRLQLRHSTSAPYTSAVAVTIDGFRFILANDSVSVQGYANVIARSISCSTTMPNSQNIFHVQGFSDSNYTTANPNSTITLGGTSSLTHADAAGLTLKFSFFTNFVLESGYANGGTYRPHLSLIGILNANIVGGRFSSVIVDNESSALNFKYIPYSPSTSGIVIDGTEAMFAYLGPTGLARIQNCTFNYGMAAKPSDFSWDTTGLNYFTKGYSGVRLSGVFAYSCTLGGAIATGSSTVDSTYSNRWAQWLGTKGNWSESSNVGNSASYRFGGYTIRMEDGYTVTLDTTINAYLYRDAITIINGNVKNIRHNRSRVRMDKTGGVNAYGKYSTLSIGGHKMAAAYVQAGTNVAITVRLRSATVRNIVRIAIPPCTAYSKDIHDHVFQRMLPLANTDYVFTFNIAPSASGPLDVWMHTTAEVTIQDFSITAT